MADRRRSRFTFEIFAHLLNIDGIITHVQANHARGMIEVFFEGNGAFAVSEGEESMVRTPEAWRRAELKQELNNGNWTRRGDIVPDQS